MRLLLLAALVSASAPAAALEAVIFPSTPLSGDGSRVHLLRLYLVDGDRLLPAVPQARAAHGAVVGTPLPAGDGGFSLRYRPPRVAAPMKDEITVTLDGRATTASIALEPAGRAQLKLTVSPDPLVLGKGAEAHLEIQVSDASGRPARAALRLGASVGKLSPPRELGPGRYQATYTPPDERFPQVAILAAHGLPGGLMEGAFAAAPLRLAARVTVPGEGEPGGTMLITVDGKTFGPQPIGPDGKFALPIVVPPGGRVSGSSTDALGNQRTRVIDLALPPFPRQLLTVVPPELPADGRAHAEVVAFAVDARGAPERGRAPGLQVDRGALAAPIARGDGAWSWTYTVPGSLGSGAITLHTAAASTRLSLRPAPPFHLELVAQKEPLSAGGSEQQVEVLLSDATASPLDGARLSATLAGGRVVRSEGRGAGRYAITVIPPRDPGRGRAALHVELAALAPGAPRRVSLHPAPPAEGRFAIEAWVDDDLGLPAPGTAIEFGTPLGVQTAVTDHYGSARLELARPTSGKLHLSAQAVALPGVIATLDALFVGSAARVVTGQAGRGVVEQESSPPGAQLDVELPLSPATPVDLRLTVEPIGSGRALRVRVARSLVGDKPGSGKLLPRASAGTLELLRAAGPDGVAELRFTPPKDGKPGAKYMLWITDAESRVTVFTEVVAP